MKTIPVEYPGIILQEEFIRPLGLTAYRVAKECGLSHPAMSEILRGKRSVTAETALRLGIYFKIEPEFWLRLQADYDLRKARREKLKIFKAQIKPVQKAA
jgi:addiction module HigA family antidote